MSDGIVEYYTLQKVAVNKGEARVTTRALLQCDLCGAVIDTSGGPGAGTLCSKCADLVKRGDARGCVVWEDAPQEKIELPKEDPTKTTKDRADALRQNSRMGGFTGDMCPECGSFSMVRNGTCQKCMACGSTTGCS